MQGAKGERQSQGRHGNDDHEAGRKSQPAVGEETLEEKQVRITSWGQWTLYYEPTHCVYYYYSIEGSAPCLPCTGRGDTEAPGRMQGDDGDALRWARQEGALTGGADFLDAESQPRHHIRTSKCVLFDTSTPDFPQI